MRILDMDLLKRDETFRYSLLGRLQADCEYYLGFGCRSTTRLWAKTEKEQIATMKMLHNSFPPSAKPVWLTYDQILWYERQMVGS